MAGGTSGDLNPIDNAKDWQRFLISGVRSPGVIAVDGIHGFERETGWDIQNGKGVKGGSLVFNKLPPAKGSFDILMWNREQFSYWNNAFAPLLRYDFKTRTNTAADALGIYYPALADLNITQVVCAKVSPFQHVGQGLYKVTIDFIEWIPPPPVSIVATTTTATQQPPVTPGRQPNPEIVQAENQALELYDQAGRLNLPPNFIGPPQL